MSGVVVERAGLVESVHRVLVINTLGEDVWGSSGRIFDWRGTRDGR